MADCIERGAAFNAILKLVPKVDSDGYCWVIRGDAAQAIDSIPSADVAEVRHGEWCEFMEDPINQRNYGGQTGYYECSNCKFVEDYRPNYCPNCGSDMRSQTNDLR